MITTGVRAVLALGLKSMLFSFAAPGGRNTGWRDAEMDSAALAFIRRVCNLLSLPLHGGEMLTLLCDLRVCVDPSLWQLDEAVDAGRIR